MLEVVALVPNVEIGTKQPLVWPVQAPEFGMEYEKAFVFTDETSVLLNKLNASAEKSNLYFSFSVIVRPNRKSISVSLGSVNAFRGSHEIRPPTGEANVLTSAPVSPPSTGDNPGGAMTDVLIFDEFVE